MESDQPKTPRSTPRLNSKLPNITGDKSFPDYLATLQPLTDKMEEIALNEAPDLFEPEDMEKLRDWMAGISNEPPAAVEKMVNNIAMRLSWALSSIVMDILYRTHNMSAFLRKIEAKIANTNLDELDISQLIELYKATSDNQHKSLEFVRRFIVQNKDTLNDINTEADELSTRLKSMSPAQLRRINKVVQDVQNKG